MKALHAPKITKALFSYTPYGYDIEDTFAPIYTALGLGNAAEQPAPAYTYLPEGLIERAGALHHFYGLDPHTAIASASRSLAASVVEGEAAKSLYYAMIKEWGAHYSRDTASLHMSEDDQIRAITHKDTKQLCFYEFSVRGDGFVAVFTAEYATPQEAGSTVAEQPPIPVAAPITADPEPKPMRHYSMLSAIAYVVGAYKDDSPFTVDLDESTTDYACPEIGVYRVNCVDVELGRITVSYLSEAHGAYAYDALTHVPQ